MLIYYSPDGQAIYIVGSGQASSAIGGLHYVSDLSRCPTSTVMCPHGPQSGLELASKLQVGYSSNMHEASLSAGAAPPQVGRGPRALSPSWQCVAMWWAAHAWAAPEYRRRWCCLICSCMPQCSAPICHYAMQAFGCSTAPLHPREGWVKISGWGLNPRVSRLPTGPAVRAASQPPTEQPPRRRRPPRHTEHPPVGPVDGFAGKNPRS